MPNRYDLRLEPDLTAETFEGDVTISLRVLHPASEIVLNTAAELEISKGDVEIEDEPGTVQRAERVELEEETERCHLTFPDTIMGDLEPAAALQGAVDQGRRIRNSRASTSALTRISRGPSDGWPLPNSNPQPHGRPSPAGTNQRSRPSLP